MSCNLVGGAAGPGRRPQVSIPIGFSNELQHTRVRTLTLILV